MKKTILIFLSIVTLISCSKDDNEYLKEKLFGQGDLTIPVAAGIDLNFSSKEIDFGTVLIGTINKQVITITNASPYPTNVMISLSEPTSTITFKENNFKIAAKGTYELEVTFLSPETVKLNNYISLLYNAGNNNSSIKITGNSVANLPTSLTVSPSGIIDFGTVLVGQASTKNITLTNTGTADAIWTPIGTALSFSPLGGTIGVGKSQQVFMTLSRSQLGTFSSTQTFSFNGGTIIVSYKVNVVAELPTTLTVSPTSTLDFGIVLIGQTVSRSVTLTNTGNSKATWKPEGTSFLFNPAAGSINPGSSQNIILALTRSTIGVYNGIQTFSFNGGLIQVSYTVNVVNQLSTTLTVTPSTTLDFGTVVVGQTATKNVTLTNIGSAAATWVPVGTTLTFSPTGGTINAGASQIVSMSIKATSTGIYNNTQSFTYNGGTIQVPYTVNRVAATRIINVSCTTSTAFGDVPVNTTSSKIIRIANTGNTPLNVSSIVVQSTPLNQITCNYSGIILPGMFAETNIHFKPTSTGSKSLSIIVQSDKTSGINSLSFSGFGK